MPGTEGAAASGESSAAHGEVPGEADADAPVAYVETSPDGRFGRVRQPGLAPLAGRVGRPVARQEAQRANPAFCPMSLVAAGADARPPRRAV